MRASMMTAEEMANAIVCENEGASWLPFRPRRKIKANESRNGHKVSAETIYEQTTLLPNHVQRQALAESDTR